MESFTVRVVNSILGPVFLSMRFPHHRKITDPKIANKYIPVYPNRKITRMAVEAHPVLLFNRPLICDVYSKEINQEYVFVYEQYPDLIKVIGIRTEDREIVTSQYLIHPDVWNFGMIGEVLPVSDILPQIEHVHDSVLFTQLDEEMFTLKAKVSVRYIILSDKEN